VVRVAGVRTFDRPPEVVFDLVADERNRYDPTVRAVELLTDEPIGEGTCFRCVSAGRRGRPVEMVVEVVRHERPRRLSTVTRLPTMEIMSTLTLDPVEAGTRMRWVSELEPQGALALLRPIMPTIARRQTRRIWDALEHHLGQHPSSAGN
jgi:hypothetical protein